MSGYLKHLAMRSIGSVASVRPRPRLRFEPLQSEATELELETEKASVESAASLSPPRPTTQPDTIASPMQSTRGDSRAPHISSDRLPEAALGAPTPSLAPNESAMFEPESQTNVVETVSDGSSNEEQRTEIPVVPTHEIKPKSSIAERSERKEPESKEIAVETHIHHSEPPPASVTPIVTQSTPTAEGQGSPIVRVNIGRVEVRAIHPPQKPDSSRSEKSKPKLSLTDYLDARHGRRR